MLSFIPAIRELWTRREAPVEEEPSAQEAVEADAPRPSEHPDEDPTSAEEPSPRRSARTYAREAGALLLMASGLYCALALASYEADPMRPGVVGENWVGPVGEVFARVTVHLLGVVAWLFPLELVVVARPLLRDRKMQVDLARISGDVVMATVLASLAHIAFDDVTAFGAMPLGGVVGELFGEVLQGLFSTVGSFLIGVTVVSLILVERATFSFIEIAQRAQAWFRRLRQRAQGGVGLVSEAWEKAREAERELGDDERPSEPLIASPEQADAIIAAFADDGDGDLPYYVRSPAPRAVASRPGLSGPGADSASKDDDWADVPTPAPAEASPRMEARLPPAPPPLPDDDDASLAVITGGDEPDEVVAVENLVTPPPPAVEAPAPTPAPVLVMKPAPEPEPEPTIVDTSRAATIRKAKRKRPKQKDAFELPGPELLDPVKDGAKRHDSQRLKEMARLLEKTLLDYKVEGKVQEIHPGPTVTMFEVSPAPGTKVSKVAGLADDLALGLSRKVRIIAPIPGKARIGFEVPNDERIPVNLRELIDSEDFASMKAALPCVLGRDVIGRPFFADLAAMPHIIVAGATGAGKSVGLNVMLVSMLYRTTPEDMRLLMIDPKVVELAPFDRIPHLLFPVVTDMKQASNALKWTVDEMERRYQLFADAGTKNIKTFNRWVKRVAAGEVPMPRGPETVEAIAPDGSQIEIPAAKDGSDAELPKKLPYIVVVVEEFADLIMTQGKEVEGSVARLAQKARAAGIHVILATQRPSVDVITGMIKANFPTRVAYRVAQKVDSRTILDQQGAEALLGRGDMLAKLNGSNDVHRVQCPFVSEDEVQRVTDMLRSQGEPDYDESIVKGPDDDDGSEPGDAETDPLYDKAVEVIAESGKCSTSWLQRKLGVGYNRAAKIVETMEKHGIVGPPNGSKPREILISAH